MKEEKDLLSEIEMNFSELIQGILRWPELTIEFIHNKDYSKYAPSLIILFIVSRSLRFLPRYIYWPSFNLLRVFISFLGVMVAATILLFAFKGILWLILKMARLGERFQEIIKWMGYSLIPLIFGNIVLGIFYGLNVFVLEYDYPAVTWSFDVALKWFFYSWSLIVFCLFLFKFIKSNRLDVLAILGLTIAAFFGLVKILMEYLGEIGLHLDGNLCLSII